MIPKTGYLKESTIDYMKRSYFDVEDTVKMLNETLKSNNKFLDTSVIDVDRLPEIYNRFTPKEISQTQKQLSVLSDLIVSRNLDLSNWQVVDIIEPGWFVVGAINSPYFEFEVFFEVDKLLTEEDRSKFNNTKKNFDPLKPLVFRINEMVQTDNFDDLLILITLGLSIVLKTN